MKAAIIGYGKMGREIERILVERGHEVVLVIDEGNTGDLTAENLGARGVEVAVEFTTPATAWDNVRACLDAGVAVVCGTTGWNDRLDDARRLCRERGGAFFYASNYSVGVNVFFKLNESLARMMDVFGAYDVTVEETHHTHKKDAPSGTAVTLAEAIVSNVERKTKWVGGATTEPGELGVVSVRRSVAPGTHTVTWESEDDRIVITHDSKNRRGLASGAVRAAEFIVGRRGVFTMDDLLIMANG